MYESCAHFCSSPFFPFGLTLHAVSMSLRMATLSAQRVSFVLPHSLPRRLHLARGSVAVTRCPLTLACRRYVATSGNLQGTKSEVLVYEGDYTKRLKWLRRVSLTSSVFSTFGLVRRRTSMNEYVIVVVLEKLSCEGIKTPYIVLAPQMQKL
jgi:hypothetical protein